MTTRRQFIAAASALPLAGAAVVAPIDHLLAAGRTEEAQAARWKAMHELFNQPAPVTPIQAAFSRWVEQQLEIRRISGTATDEEMESACDRGFVLALEVSRLPAETVSDMALKVYLQMHCEHGEASTGTIFDVAVPTGTGVIRDMKRSLYADLFRFVEPFTVTA